MDYKVILQDAAELTSEYLDIKIHGILGKNGFKILCPRIMFVFVVFQDIDDRVVCTVLELDYS